MKPIKGDYYGQTNASFEAMTREEAETMLTLNRRYLEILKEEFSKI